MKFRKRPVVIDAIQNLHNQQDEVAAFLGPNRNLGWMRNDLTNVVTITTMEGSMRAESGDWIIKGIKGEFYPCKPDVFEETYDPVD